MNENLFMPAPTPLPVISGADIEKAIVDAGKTAPRITPDNIKAAIGSVNYFTAGEGASGAFPQANSSPSQPSLDLLTFCVITLRNGFTVTGESACASPTNFDPEIGRQIAYKNAVDKIWMLEGYLLRQKLFDGSRALLAAAPPALTDLTNLSVDDIARVCHEVNRGYCEALGEPQPSWEDAPLWQKESAMLGVTLHLENRDAGAEASHVSWMNQKLADGWTYGPVKLADQKQHPCLVPFNQLDPAQQAKDYIFRAVVHALS